MNRTEEVSTILGWNNWFVVEASGFKGGLALMWVNELDIEVLNSSNQIIHCKVKSESVNNKWLMIRVYGSPYAKDKTLLWD